jgi:hypothetical protein
MNKMSDFLTAELEREIKKAASERMALIRKRGSNRQLGHLVEGTGNYQVQKGDCERAVSKLHATHDTGVSRVIQKRVEPSNDAANMIRQMHSDPATFADRPVAGNSNLVEKLVRVVAEAVQQDFKTAKAAKATLRKLIED